MPLKKGSSRKTFSHNIKEMVDSWKKSGAIGNSHPVGKKKAVKQAVAIALDKSRDSKRLKANKKSYTASTFNIETATAIIKSSTAHLR